MLRKRATWGWLAAGLVGLAGCVGYSSYPEVDSLAPSSPNFIHVKPVVSASLKEVIRKHHPDWAGAYAVNLPPEMTDEARAQIMSELGPSARAMTPESQHLPTYHVSRVWVRGPEAKVDVIRPVLELGPKPDGGIVYQGMTVWLEAGLNPWRVEFIQPWSMRVVTPPDANFVERPAQDTPSPTQPGQTEPDQADPDQAEPNRTQDPADGTPEG